MIRRSKFPVTQYQVVTSPGTFALDDQGRKHAGTAICPYCECANRVVYPAAGGLAYAENETRCRHSRGAVDAGGFRIAIHFVGLESERRSA